MATPQFVHLHVHTEYSVRDGMCRIGPLIEAAVSDRMPAMAITDLENCYGSIKFYQHGMKAGIKPLIGAQLRLACHSHFMDVVLLCMSHTGYLHLSKWVTQQQADFSDTSVIPWQDLCKASTQDLMMIVLPQSNVWHVAEDAETKTSFAEMMAHLVACFGDRLCIGLARLGHAGERERERIQVACAQHYECPLVATNGVCFIQEDDFTAHEARVCIDRGETLDQPRDRQHTPQQYLRSTAEMVALFADHPQAIANTVRVAKRCNFQFVFGVNHLPDFPIAQHETLDDHFIKTAKTGLEKRFEKALKNVPKAKRQVYWTRLDTECQVIIRMQFPGYFLIVADFIAWSRTQGIPVGPGRGSGAGSLVAYALGITDIDPIHYQLLFERFLNPERVSMPDFDIDFCMDGRDRVIEYVATRYGHDHVSQIITFGTMAAKAVVRDVGRVLGHPYGFVDRLAKLIPMDLGITLDKALAQEPLLAERYADEPEVKHLLTLAMKLEGVVRQVGRHAGGVVISPKPLVSFMPLYLEADQGSISQFDKDDLERIGLVKFDFLGLRTLTIIDWTLQALNAAQVADVDMGAIPLDDPKVFTMLQACHSTAIFQLESRGMKDLIKRLRPDCFEDLVSLVALFRPGPLQSGMVDDFIDRKHGRAEIRHLHPSLAPILDSTYGVILYQEQVMQIAQTLSGYTLGGADLLRRAMGKKKPEEMAKQRSIFIHGAMEQDVPKHLAGTIFDVIEKFAGYGFNRSHSVAYAMLSYQTAWLKAHHPAFFMASVLSSDMDNTDKIVVFLEECGRMKLVVQRADINHSMYAFKVNAQGDIVYGLGAIKGVGQAAAETLVAYRQAHGQFQDLVSVCMCLAESGKLNKRLLEALCQAGALDGLGQPRWHIFASIEKAVQQADRQLKDRASGQRDMFVGVTQTTGATFEYVQVQPWTDARRLKGEHDSLGYYFSGHPMDQVLPTLKALGVRGCHDLPMGQVVRCCGLVIGVRLMQSKSGRPMAFATLEDRRGRVDVALFGKTVDAYRALLVKGAQLVVSGEASVDDYSGGTRLQAQEVWTVEALKLAHAKVLHLHIDARQAPHDFHDVLAHMFATIETGDVRLLLHIEQAELSTTILAGQKFGHQLSDFLIGRLDSLHWLRHRLGYDIPKSCRESPCTQ